VVSSFLKNEVADLGGVGDFAYYMIYLTEKDRCVKISVVPWMADQSRLAADADHRGANAQKSVRIRGNPRQF